MCKNINPFLKIALSEYTVLTKQVYYTVEHPKLCCTGVELFSGCGNISCFMCSWYCSNFTNGIGRSNRSLSIEKPEAIADTDPERRHAPSHTVQLLEELGFG
jgi:hypothetical protein